MDLLDWHRGALSSRRLRVLIEHLPADSSLARERHGEAAQWSITDHLLAAVVDHLAVANWMFATANSDPDADPLPYPEPVPRPGLDSAADSAADPAADSAPPETTAAEILTFLRTPA